jgi:hypothetical protein
MTTFVHEMFNFRIGDIVSMWRPMDHTGGLSLGLADLGAEIARLEAAYSRRFSTLPANSDLHPPPGIIVVIRKCTVVVAELCPKPKMTILVSEIVSLFCSADIPLAA